MLYLVNVKTRKTEPIFHILIVGLYLFIPLYLTVYLSGFNLLTLINNSWRTWATPTQYAVFMVLAYELSYKKTQDTPYSMVLSVHMASAAGYLYEIPRYLTLQGIRGVIRFNKFSVFRIDYAILAVFVVLWLLWKKGFKVNRLLLCEYCLYNIWYFYNFNYFQSLKYLYAWVYEIRVPWICIFRFPTMLFLLYLTQTLNTPTHPPTHNDV